MTKKVIKIQNLIRIKENLINKNNKLITNKLITSKLIVDRTKTIITRTMITTFISQVSLMTKITISTIALDTLAPMRIFRACSPSLRKMMKRVKQIDKWKPNMSFQPRH